MSPPAAGPHACMDSSLIALLFFFLSAPLPRPFHSELDLMCTLSAFSFREDAAEPEITMQACCPQAQDHRLCQVKLCFWLSKHIEGPSRGQSLPSERTSRLPPKCALARARACCQTQRTGPLNDSDMLRSISSRPDGSSRRGAQTACPCPMPVPADVSLHAPTQAVTPFMPPVLPFPPTYRFQDALAFQHSLAEVVGSLGTPCRLKGVQTTCACMRCVRLAWSATTANTQAAAAGRTPSNAESMYRSGCRCRLVWHGVGLQHAW